MDGAVDMSFGSHATRIRKELPSGTFAVASDELSQDEILKSADVAM